MFSLHCHYSLLLLLPIITYYQQGNLQMSLVSDLKYSIGTNHHALIKSCALAKQGNKLWYDSESLATNLCTTSRLCIPSTCKWKSDVWKHVETCFDWKCFDLWFRDCFSNILLEIIIYYYRVIREKDICPKCFHVADLRFQVQLPAEYNLQWPWSNGHHKTGLVDTELTQYCFAPAPSKWWVVALALTQNHVKMYNFYSFQRQSHIISAKNSTVSGDVGPRWALRPSAGL